MSSLALKALISSINAQIDALNNTNTKIYDEENREFFLSNIRYIEDEDKLVFTTSEDRERL